jgi:hypothetical protein
MKRTLTVLGTTALVGISLTFGAGPASASTCPAGQGWNAMGGGAGFCAPVFSGGGTGGGIGGNGSVDLGGGNTTVPQAPVFNAPAPYKAPVYAPVPAGNAPVRGTAPHIQAPPVQNHAPGAPTPVRAPQAPAAGYAPAYTAPGGTAVQPTQGVGANPATGAVAEAGAAPADVPADAPAVVLPVTEAQAVDALRSAAATAEQKFAALAVVTDRIGAALDKALANR